MKSKWFGALLIVMMVVVTMVPAAGAAPQQAGGTRLIPAGGTTSIRASAPVEVSGVQYPELRPKRHISKGGEMFNQAETKSEDEDIFPERPLKSPKVKSSKVTDSNRELELSFDGLNHRDQRTANNGNQFSLEPPDQALCVGNGYVVEVVNSVFRVWDTDGNVVSGVQDLNTFFGYPAAIVRTDPPVFGPFVIDPVCYYDPENERFIVVITTLHQNPDGSLTGRNTIDLAVSNTGDPTGIWTVYNVPAQNDGTEGTPDHGCTLDGLTPGPCFQDYPHVGADKYGVYVSTNEYDMVGPSYSGAQVFAFSKAELAAHGDIRVTLVEDLMLEGTRGFTVWPATSPAGEYSREANGTEYFLSTIAGDGSETGNPTGTARYLGLWALSNTKSLNSATPALRISSRAIESQRYVFPPTSDQRPGDIPLGECINDTTIPTPFGPGCWQLFFVAEPAHDEVLSHPDSLDSRMQQTWYVDGMLWGASGTAVKVGGEIKAGIAWFAVDPEVNKKGRVKGEVEKQGYIALKDNNLTMPAIAIGPDGKGVIAFSVMGEDYFPSAAYVTINSKGKVSPIHIAAEGLGPDDGFTSYKAFVGDPPRTRWGDYGAAVTDGNDIWIASEYIAQTCTFEEYIGTPVDLGTGPVYGLIGFGSCGGTRTSLANWATRISKIDP